ncbi:MAG: NADP-dependent isocitrate dehydrogenase [Simkaniaceae bacterium]|nr:MAG: NADP-dependent isocitrate dehydrogenase [Simkaniaceae bacterium]
MNEKVPITVARGDGIGPEIMEATLKILKGAGAQLTIHEVEIGEKVYLGGHPTGIEDKTWETIRNTKAFLKAPITTPQGGGFKSLNVTIRTTLGLYANIRPCVSYSPFVATKHPEMDVVIVRENEEDLYSGIEYRQSPEVCESIKLISQPGSEKIIRYAFEYAKINNRKKVTCFVKDNIMKLSDGLFHQVFQEVAKEYPDIENEHWIVDIGAAKLADTPEAFDVIVMPNLYGDILSDVGAQIAGSVGLVGSANIGDHGAMFEAIHGSAPRRAGQNVANPSALILASILMLIHIGQSDKATAIHNAWLKTLEDGIHTYDIFKEGVSKKKVGTQEFAGAVIERLGQKPAQLHPVSYKNKEKQRQSFVRKEIKTNRVLVGADLFIYSPDSLDDFVSKITDENFGDYKIEMISNRGARVYPDGMPETFCIDQWRVRFRPNSEGCTQEGISELFSKLTDEGYDIIKTEHLYDFDGKPGYSSPKG